MKTKQSKRMLNAFTSCQRPWSHILIKRGDRVIMPGSKKPMSVFRLDYTAIRSTFSARNNHYPIACAFIPEISQWIRLSELMRW